MLLIQVRELFPKKFRGSNVHTYQNNQMTGRKQSHLNFKSRNGIHYFINIFLNSCNTTTTTKLSECQFYSYSTIIFICAVCHFSNIPTTQTQKGKHLRTFNQRYKKSAQPKLQKLSTNFQTKKPRHFDAQLEFSGKISFLHLYQFCKSVSEQRIFYRLLLSLIPSPSQNQTESTGPVLSANIER